MQLVLTVSVRNPEWYWSKEEIQEAGDYYEQWQVLNEDKVHKHKPMWQYHIPFDVLEITENRNSEYDLKFIGGTDKETTIIYTLKDATVVKLIGAKETIEAVVSNALIYNYRGAHKVGAKHYVYIYLKENTEYFHPIEKLFWITTSEEQELKDLNLSFEG